MPLTAAQVADLKDKYQYFTCQFVAFPAITWSVTDLAAFSGAITWQPFCLLSPRFSYTSGADVTISGTDSYVRPTTAVSTVTFTKSSGTGTVTDNGNKTCTVSGASGVVVVEAVATDAAAETATAYAYVYGGSVGNMDAIIARADGFSGSLATGEWQADLVLRGDYSALLTNDGRDQPILMHVNHYFDGAENTFGGYVHHNNTFVMLCREAHIRVTHTYEYETVLHVESPAYVLKQSFLIAGELNFSTPGNGGDLTTSNLTATDVAYFFLREGTNLHQYFNMTLWNNSSTFDKYNVKPNASFWEIVQGCHNFNFGMVYFDRWGSLLGKPDPRARHSDWDAISDEVYSETNPLTTAHMLEYELYRRRTDRVGRVAMQAVLPDMTIIDRGTDIGGSIGELVEVNSLVATNSTELDSWIVQYGAWLNTEYEITMRLPMGHELNPGDLFYMAALDPPIGDTVAATSWICDDINYEFDFTRGFWTRRIHAVKISTSGA